MLLVDYCKLSQSLGNFLILLLYWYLKLIIIYYVSSAQKNEV